MPRRGVRVATLSDDDVRELYEVRDVLERHAVRPRCRRRPDGWPACAPRCEAMARRPRRGDRLAVADAHRASTSRVVALAGNRQLTALYESVLVQLQLYMAVNLRREAEVAHAPDGVAPARAAARRRRRRRPGRGARGARRGTAPAPYLG